MHCKYLYVLNVTNKGWGSTSEVEILKVYPKKKMCVTKKCKYVKDNKTIMLIQWSKEYRSMAVIVAT